MPKPKPKDLHINAKVVRVTERPDDLELIETYTADDGRQIAELYGFRWGEGSGLCIGVATAELYAPPLA